MSGIDSTRDVDQSNEPTKPYWHQVYGIMDLNVLNCDYECKAFAPQINLTSYCQETKDFLDEDEKPKYLHLATLALVALCLSHENS